MTTIPLKKLYSGKVRDLYEIDEQTMLIVASDRLSAFDVILNEPIPQKGEILTQISNFWFNKLAHIMPNHFTGQTVYDILPAEQARAIEQRAVVAKRLAPVKIEAVVRGYISGSGWEAHPTPGGNFGNPPPPPPAPAPPPRRRWPAKPKSGWTAASARGKTSSSCCDIIGSELAEQVRAKAIQLYTEAAEYAATRGIIIADTKFEFGLDAHGTLTLMDEVLTPDSSRFWAAQSYQIGSNPPSFDKQFIRDWLEHSGWNKQPPAPTIPADVLAKTVAKYQEALRLLTA